MLFRSKPPQDSSSPYSLLPRLHPSFPFPLSDDALSFLATSELWCLVRPDEPASLRRAMYELLGAVVERSEGLLGEEGVKIVAGWVMRSCWGEDEGWAGVVAFLRREFVWFARRPPS